MRRAKKFNHLLNICSDTAKIEIEKIFALQPHVRNVKNLLVGIFCSELRLYKKLRFRKSFCLRCH